MFFHTEYKKIFSPDKKVTKINQEGKKNLDTLNQTVYIRDLIVRVADFGESCKHTNSYSQLSGTRLQTHLSSLMNLANEDHRANNCRVDKNGDYHLKKGKENHITRLSTHEFSFYTKAPLSVEEFQSLLRDIEKMAAGLEPNVHVLLSSFAVHNNPSLFNMSVFVEGGKPPIMRCFYKNNVSTVDIDYGKTETLFSKQVIGERLPAEITTTDSVFVVTTQGGASYIQAFDVCLDHRREHSKKLLQQLIATSHEILPDQIEQGISSNSVEIEEEATFSTKVLHVDPNFSMHSTPKPKLGPRTLTHEAKNRIIYSGYKDMTIETSETGYCINNPSFGSSCIVETFENRPAGRYLPTFQTAIKNHNQKLLEKEKVPLVSMMRGQTVII